MLPLDGSKSNVFPNWYISEEQNEKIWFQFWLHDQMENNYENQVAFLLI